MYPIWATGLHMDKVLDSDFNFLPYGATMGILLMQWWIYLAKEVIWK